MHTLIKTGKCLTLAGCCGLMLAQPAQAGLFGRLLSNNTPEENPAKLLVVDKSGQPQTLDPVKKIMIGEVNVEVGTKLERLSMISGEGHMEKKIAGGLMAAGIGLFGIAPKGEVVDTAFREPIAEHLKPEDAQTVANDIAQIFNENFHPEGMDVVKTQDVGSAAFYSGIKGATKIDDTLPVKIGDKDIEVGFYRIPAGGLKYRDKSLFNFSSSDSEVSPHAAELGAQGNVKADISLYNDREYMRLHNFSISFYVNGSKPGEASRWMQVTLSDPYRAAVKTGDENFLEHWPEMRKVLATLVAESAKNLSLGRPAAASQATPANAAAASGVAAVSSQAAQPPTDIASLKP